MLELDVFLLPFIDSQFNQMSTRQREQYSRLLDEPDPDIFAWLMGYESCERYPELIDAIRNFRQHEGRGGHC